MKNEHKKRFIVAIAHNKFSPSNGCDFIDWF